MKIKRYYKAMSLEDLSFPYLDEVIESYNGFMDKLGIFKEVGD